MAQGWMKCAELQGLAQLASAGLGDLFDWCIDGGEAAQKALSYVVHLMGNRASSLSMHGAPPHCYANVLESRDALHARVVKQMKRDWTSLVWYGGHLRPYLSVTCDPTPLKHINGSLATLPLFTARATQN